ncbi:MAG: hypothetical protein OSB25_08770 [Salibacteraceae bacterium]|nr:hypothetical protein [Salibacteraceae bacterium]
MDFSSGQLKFAGFFLVVFILVMIFAYWKDRKIIKAHYKGVSILFLIIFSVIAFYWVLVKVL